MRTQVERVRSLPCGGGVIHDKDSGSGPVVWVEEHRISEQAAQLLEENVNEATRAKGRSLTFAEIMAMVPFVV
jgi:hypothetical protein